MKKIKSKVRKIFFYLLMMLFILPACSGSKSIYDQKRSLMILDVSEQPRNKKALQNSKKRYKTNKKKAKNKRRHTKSYKRR
jgi:hypothetical protein